MLHNSYLSVTDMVDSLFEEELLGTVVVVFVVVVVVLSVDRFLLLVRKY